MKPQILTLHLPKCVLPTVTGRGVLGGKHINKVTPPEPANDEADKRHLRARKKKSESKRPIESYEHGDKELINNPSVGLMTLGTDPGAGQKKKRYAYDPHLDPQLVWAGKAEHTSFEVSTVSLSSEAGEHKRTAVKIVDDPGIEILKVVRLE
jgi:adenine-specific DNA-methyltransferase